MVFKISDRKLARHRNTIIPFVLGTNYVLLYYGIVLLSHLLMRDGLSHETDTGRLLVSSALSTPLLTLIGSDDSLTCHLECI